MIEYLRTYGQRSAVPVLKKQVPVEVTSMHQIEITSRCNLRCKYCPSPNLGRDKVDMTEAHYRRCLEWAAYYVRRGTQTELNLAGIGESTLHPLFVDFVRLAREAVGEQVMITLTTNGVGYGEDLVEAIAPYRPSVFVSLHRPEKAAHAVRWFRERRLLRGVSADPSINANDWAGQVDWMHTQRDISACMWLRQGFVMAMADGRITTCCIDATGDGVCGHVDDPIGSVRARPYSLCDDCHQEIAIEGVTQNRTPGRLAVIG